MPVDYGTCVHNGKRSPNNLREMSPLALASVTIVMHTPPSQATNQPKEPMEILALILCILTLLSIVVHLCID